MSDRPVPNAYLRVSDADRQVVVDLLKQHAADGRLDAAEFEARLDHTLRAKTRGDLAGLLDDLPDLNGGRGRGPGPGGQRPVPSGSHDRERRSRGPIPTLVTVGLVILAVCVIGSAIAHAVFTPWFHFPWFVLAIVALILWRRSHRHCWRA